jgi:putative ABC transport system permease protein
MLGIIIGVGAVITMVAVGAGAQARVEDQIKSLGSNLIIVLSGNFTTGGARQGSGSQLTITEDDAYAMQREVPGVQAAAPALRGSGQVVFGNSNWATQIRARRPSSSRRGSGTSRPASRSIRRTSTPRRRSCCSARPSRNPCSARRTR